MNHLNFSANFYWRNKLKILSLWIFVLCLSTMGVSAQNDIHIGDGGTSTSSYVPIYYLFNFSYSQAIYTAEEMQEQGAIAGSINKIKYLPNASTGTANWKDWVVYIGQTDKEGFVGNDDWIETDAMELVFDGEIPDQVTGGEWMEITLDTPFDWDGESNIVVAVDSNTEAWGNTPNWAGYTLEPSVGSKAIYYYSDGTNPDPDNPVTASNTTNIAAQIKFHGDLFADCEGEPEAGTLVDSELNVCEGRSFSVAVEGAAAPAGDLIRNWQSSPAGEDDWTDIEGANEPSYTVSDGISEDTDYRFMVVCGEDDPVYSDIIEVTLKPGNECYCIPTGATNNADEIRNFSLGTIDNDSDASEGTNGYMDYTDTVPPAELEIGESYVASLTAGSGSGNHGAAIWIDLNDNGIFEEDEMVAHLSEIAASSTVEFPAFIAADAPGTHRLRVQYRYNMNGEDLDPCVVSTYAETEDYLVDFITLDPCEGEVTAGDIAETEMEVCAETSFTLAVENATASADGLTRQWQSSPAGEDDWTDIEGANYYSYQVSEGITTETDYRFVITCENSDETDYSEVIEVTLKPAQECYCTPGGTNPSYFINNFSTANGVQNIENMDSGFSEDGYGDFTENHIVSQVHTESIEFSADYSGGTFGTKVWVDWNQDGQFTEDEIVYQSSTYTNSASGTIEVPETAELGETRMRIGISYTPNSGPNDPCEVGTREFEDYTFEVLPLEDCTGTPTAGTVETEMEVCAGVPFHLVTESSTDPANGLIRVWQSSPAGEDDWTDIEGSNTPDFVLEEGISEPTDFRYMVVCELTDESDISDVIVVTLKPSNECYCIPEGTNPSYYINNFTTTNGVDNIENLDSGFSEGGYGDFSDTHTVAQVRTESVNFNADYSGGTFGTKIWVDWNQDGQFTEDEIVFQTSSYASNASGTIDVPESAELGETRMRIGISYTPSSGPNDPCESGSREFEDYTFEVLPLEDCAGDIEAGEPIEDSINICVGTTFTVGVTGSSNPANNLYRRWQSSPAGENDWTDIEDSNYATFTIEEGVLEDTDFRYALTCSDDEPVYSDIIEVTLKPGYECYCIPTGSSNNSDEIVNFSLDDFSNDSSPSEGDSGYSDYTDLGPITLIPGVEYVASLTSGTGSGNHGAAIWIDYNNDGFFSEDEKVAWIDNSIPSSTTVDFPAFMAGVQTGEHRLRVQYSHNKSGEEMDPCNITSSFSETEDYTVLIVDVDCFPPTAITIGYITDNSAQVTWEGSGETEWTLYYGEEGFDPETEGESIQVLDEPLVNLEDLDGSTTYDVYIKTICEGEDSVLIGPRSFTTLITPPENTRLCDAIMLEANAGCVGGPWTNVGAFEEVDEPVGSCLNDFHGTNSVWFSFVAPANGLATITTNFTTTNFNTELAAFAAPEDCEDLSTLGEEVGCAASNEDLVLEGLTPGATYYVKVTGFFGAEGDFCIEVQMDDTPAPCQDPSDIAVTDVEDTIATVEWTANGSETQWEVAYGLAGFDLDTEGQTEVVDTNSIVLTDLNAETDYDVYVRALCNENLSSDWVGPENFTTEPMSVASEIFNDFSYYPNPVQEVLTLKATAQIEKVEVFNLLGQSVMILTPNVMETQLNTEQLQSGAYLMKVNIEGATKTFRIIKK